MQFAKPMHTPIIINLKLTTNGGLAFSNPSLYRSVVLIANISTILVPYLCS